MQVKEVSIWMSTLAKPGQFDTKTWKWNFPSMDGVENWTNEFNRTLEPVTSALHSAGWAERFSQPGFELHIGLHDAPETWKMSRNDEGFCSLYLAPWIREWWAPSAAASAVAGILPWLLRDLYAAPYPKLPETDALGGPLITITGAPRSGARASWHRSPPIDAFAKAVRVIGDLGADIIRAARLMSIWPDLELHAFVGSTSAPRLMQGGRVCVVSTPRLLGKSTMVERGEFALSAVINALRLRGELDEFDTENTVAQLIDAVRSGRYAGHLTGAVELPDESGTRFLRPEFVCDPDGGRIRAVVTDTAGRRAVSAWRPAGPSLAYLRWAWQPFSDYEWLGESVRIMTQVGGRQGFSFTPKLDQTPAP